MSAEPRLRRQLSAQEICAVADRVRAGTRPKDLAVELGISPALTAAIARCPNPHRQVRTYVCRVCADDFETLARWYPARCYACGARDWRTGSPRRPATGGA